MHRQHGTYSIEHIAKMQMFYVIEIQKTNPAGLVFLNAMLYED